MPVCLIRAGGGTLTTRLPGGFRYWASNESDNGTSSVIWFREIAAIRRSMGMAVPVRIQVCGRPFVHHDAFLSPFLSR